LDLSNRSTSLLPSSKPQTSLWNSFSTIRTIPYKKKRFMRRIKEKKHRIKLNKQRATFFKFKKGTDNTFWFDRMNLYKRPTYYIKVAEGGVLEEKVIESVSRTIKKNLGEGKMFCRVHPYIPITKKPLETRLGKGRGAIDRWVSVVRPGRVLFEISGLPDDEVKPLIRVTTKMIGLKTYVTYEI